MIATSVRCADWLARFSCQISPAPPGAPTSDTSARANADSKRARELLSPFISFFMFWRLDCSRSIGLITRRALPPRHSTGDLPKGPKPRPSTLSWKVSETMDCLCARLALWFDYDTQADVLSIDLPFDGYNERENNGHVLCCSSSCLSFQWFLSGRVAQFVCPRTLPIIPTTF